MWLSALNLCVCICVCVCVFLWVAIRSRPKTHIYSYWRAAVCVDIRANRFIAIFMIEIYVGTFFLSFLMFCLHIHAHIAQIYYTHTESIAICGASNAMQSSLQTQGRVNQRAKPYGWVHKSQNTHTQHTVWPTATTTSLIRCRIILPQSLSSFFTAPFFIHSRKPCAVFICSHVYIYGH